MANVKIKKAVLDNLAAGYSHHHESKKQNSNYDKLEQIVEKQVSERLNVICEGNLSGSILILGSEDRDQFINKVIKKNEYLKKSPVVYISGLSCQSENQAMFQIADAFLLRNNAERNPNIVLEDLEIFFRQRKMESSPAVIVIDHIHEFAKRESSKQVLIYTLLDLMHKPDMFFVLVGMTPCFHLHMLLERRVVSRLNAQTVFLNAGSPVDICSLLSVRLQLEYDEDSIFSTQEEVVQLLNYNKSVSTLFGDFIQEDKKGVGILYGLIECYVNWGYTADWFLRLAETVIQSLPNQSSGGLKLTAEMFEAAIARQQQPTLAERVAGLTHLQLHLLAAVCRLCFLPDAKRTVGTVLSDMDKLTGVFRRKDVSVDMVYLALHSLTEVNLLWLTNGTSSGSAERTLSTQYISHSTAVHLVPPPEEIQSLFHLKPLRCRQAKESHVEPTSIMSSISAAFTAVTGFESPLTIRAISGENIGLHPDLTILRSKRKRTAVVPRTGSLPAGNLFRSSPSASSKDATGSSSEKQWQNSWYCDESFHFRTQPTLVVSERVRKSVLEPHVPVLTTSLN